MDPARLALVKVDGFPQGAGYLIGPHLVLTALHVVRSGTTRALRGGVSVRVGHPTLSAGLFEREAVVCWPEPRGFDPDAPRPDVALLWLAEPVAPMDVLPLRWGRPRGVRPLAYDGAGFPVFAESPAPGGVPAAARRSAPGARDGAPEPQVEYLRGELPLVSTSGLGPGGRGWVLDTRVWPEGARRSGAAGSPWAGVSGAAVLCSERLVAVVAQADDEVGQRRLHAEPLHLLLDDPAFLHFLEVHGDGGVPAVEEVTAEVAHRAAPSPASAAQVPTSPPRRTTRLDEGADDGGYLPVLQVPPAELEIHQAALPGRTDRVNDRPTPYLERSFDAELRTLMAAVLAGGPSAFAVLTGESSTGKTRALYEALVALAPDRPLLRPADGQDLLDLIEDRSVPPGAVLWLNESQRFLDGAHGEKAAVALHRLLRGRPGLLAVGTMWDDPYWRQLTRRGVPGDPHSHARALLTGPLCAPVTVPAELSYSERRRWLSLSQRNRDPRLLRALEASRSDGRVIQHLSGGPELLTAFRQGPGRVFDHFEWALISAALGARRLGHQTPLTAELLIAAADGELTSRQRGIDPDGALEAVSSGGIHCALPALIRVRSSVRGQTTYEPADYLDQHTRASHQRLLGSPALWAALTAHATNPRDLEQLAKSAWERGFRKLAMRLGKKAVLAGGHRAPAELVGWLSRPLDPLDEGACWVAGHASLTDPWAVAHLLEALRSSGVPNAIDVLRDRPQPTPERSRPDAVIRQLRVLHDIGATQSLELAAARAVATIDVTDPQAVAPLLQILRTAGLRERSAELLGRDPVGQAKLSPLRPMVDLLTALLDTGETQHFTVLARRVVTEANLSDPGATASLLTALHEAGAVGAKALAQLIGRGPAEQVDPANARHLPDLLHTLYDLNECQAHMLLAQRAVDTVDVTDPTAVATLLLALHETQAHTAVDALLGRDPVGLASLSRPDLVHHLLEVLTTIGEAPSFVRLARRMAVEGDLTPANWTAALLKSLREAGAIDVITQLLSRQPAEHAHLSNQHLLFGGWSGIVNLLAELHAVADTTGVDTLIRRIADEADLDNPVHVSLRLKALYESGVPHAADALALRIAAATDVTDPGTTGVLLSALHETHTAEALDLLLRRGPAHQADVTKPDVFLLLEALEQSGASGAVEELLERDPAEHVDLLHPKDAARMVDTLRRLGAKRAAQTLVERAEQMGLAQPDDHDVVYGYETDGRLAMAWTWSDLDDDEVTAPQGRSAASEESRS